MSVRSLYLPDALLAECHAEAERHYPFESGGTFMGYIHDNCTVVEALIPPGPKAKRSRYGFAPDQAWQLAEIARCYERSGRRTTYLGDWHSHPNAGSGELSAKDRGVLRRIIETTDARCPNPLMAIFWGAPASSWSLSVWSASFLPRRLFARAIRVDTVHCMVTS